MKRVILGTKKKAPRNEPQRLPRHVVGDQLVCWIAESSQSAPRRRAKVQTSVASIGVSLPETRRPVVRSSGLVDQREPHRHAGEIGFAFAPGFGEVALQQLDVGHLVDVVAGLVLLEILGEVGHHLGRRQRMQFGDVLVRPCGLDLTEQTLEGFIVSRLDFQRRLVRSQPKATQAGAEAGLGARAFGSRSRSRRVGGGRRMAALPPRHRQPHHQDDQADLQQQADDRRQAAEAGEQPAAGQHAEQAGAKEAHGETAEHAPHHSGPVEEAALGGRASRRRAHAGGAGLGKGTVHGLRRARRGGGARGRRIGFRSPRTGTAAAANAGVGRRDRDRQRERHGQDNGQCPNNSARALREIHVFFLSPQDGEAPLTWAQLLKSEATIGNRNCGPQSRGCDDLAGG